MAEEGAQLGNVGGGILGMPLHADDGCVDRFNGFDGAVRGIGAHLQALAHACHALVVGGGDDQLRVGEDGCQGALKVRSPPTRTL